MHGHLTCRREGGRGIHELNASLPMIWFGYVLLVVYCGEREPGTQNLDKYLVASYQMPQIPHTQTTPFDTL